MSARKTVGTYYMKKYITVVFIAVLSLISITSCIKDDMDLSECYYQIRIEPRWIDTEPVRDNDSTHLEILYNNNTGRIDLNTSPAGRVVELVPNVYNIVGFEPAQNVTVDNNVVSVATNPDGAVMDPGPFTAGEVTAEVYPTFEDQLIIVPMRRQTRKLIIEVRVTGSGISLVESISGSMSGIAVSREVNDCFPPASGVNRPLAITGGAISYSFQENADEWFVGTRTLLGIDGNSQQNLNLNIAFINGEVVNLVQDVTGGMTGFHTQDIHQPWYIVLELNLGFDLQATITNWYAGPDSWLVAE